MLPKINSQRQFLVPMIIIGSLFFIFGFVTWLNSVLIPFLRQACQLTDFQAFFVTFAFYFFLFHYGYSFIGNFKEDWFCERDVDWACGNGFRFISIYSGSPVKVISLIPCWIVYPGHGAHVTSNSIQPLRYDSWSY